MTHASQLIVSLFLISNIAMAGTTGRKKLLECNIPSGDYQQIQVFREGPNLILQTLSQFGSLDERIIPASQWAERNISVPCRHSVNGKQCGQVYDPFVVSNGKKEFSGKWQYKVGSRGFYDYGSCL
jgi:hypothetical protein